MGRGHTSKNRIVLCQVRVKSQDPDVIFFIEQWYPVFGLVRKVLEPEYKFVFPKGFNPSYRNDKGEYPSFAGVVAAIKSGIWVTAAVGGKDYVDQAGKWLNLEINGCKFLGVHYPQDKNDITVFKNFHNGVKKFVEQEKPLAIMGDFNTPKVIGVITIDGYKDLLSAAPTTSALDTKLDYIFLPDNYCGAKAELIQAAMRGETIFSDHCATMVTL